MHKNIIDSIILSFCRVYLNPRTEITNFQCGDWIFCSDADFVLDNADSCKQINIDWNLYLKINNEIMTISEVKSIFFDELSELKSNVDFELYDLISSMLNAFYLPYTGFYNENNFIHQKFISYIQLSANSDNIKLNTLYRNIYIKSIFYNSFFVDNLRCLEFKENEIYFKKKKLVYIFFDLRKYQSNPVFFNVIEYCISFLNFLEKGLNKNTKNTIDDVFFKNCNYLYFDKKIEPYFYKKTIFLINKMYYYPNTSIGILFNKMFILNFIIFNKNYQYYIRKYIDTTNIDKINIDITYLEKNFIKNKHIYKRYKVIRPYEEKTPPCPTP